MSECVASALGNWEAGVCSEDWALEPTPYVPRVGSGVRETDPSAGGIIVLLGN